MSIDNQKKGELKAIAKLKAMLLSMKSLQHDIAESDSHMQKIFDASEACIATIEQDIDQIIAGSDQDAKQFKDEMLALQGEYISEESAA